MAVREAMAMTDPGLPRFDFDEWSRLARHDPRAFEARRLAMLEAVIESGTPPRRQRLRGLQWRIDRERERCPSPLSACVRLSDMMWRSFAGPGGLSESLRRWPSIAPATSPQRCCVLVFPGHRRSVD